MSSTLTSPVCHTAGGVDGAGAAGEDGEAAAAQVMAVTGQDRGTAVQLLEASGGDTTAAIGLFFNFGAT